MRRLSVDSETIRSMGYAPRRCELDIEFRQNGEVYRYSGVSAAEYAEFIAAESKGRYLNLVFKPKDHAYVILRHHRTVATATFKEQPPS